MKYRLTARVRHDQAELLSLLNSNMGRSLELAISLAGDPPDRETQPGSVEVSGRISDDAKDSLDRWALAYGGQSRGLRAAIETVTDQLREYADE
jgi:hypothetical protein